MHRIDFAAKTDRELLVLVAQSCNETSDHLARLNNTILKHEKRLTNLEMTHCDDRRPQWKANWRLLGLVASVLALIIMEIVQRLG